MRGRLANARANHTENNPNNIALVHMTDGLSVTFKHHRDSMGNERDNNQVAPFYKGTLSIILIMPDENDSLSQ